MASQNRYPVVPTVTVLAIMKVRLQGATKGHALLKKKADALTVRFRAILRQIIEAKEQMGQQMRDSFFTLIEAKYAAGDNMHHTVFDNVEQASFKVYSQQDNVAGVKIPKFQHGKVGTGADTKMDLTGGWREPQEKLTSSQPIAGDRFCGSLGHVFRFQRAMFWCGMGLNGGVHGVNLER